MKPKQKLGRETKQKRAFSAILGAALLFLGVVLGINFVNHLQTGDVFAAVISGLGALLFFAVGAILLSELVRRKDTQADDAEVGNEEE